MKIFLPSRALAIATAAVLAGCASAPSGTTAAASPAAPRKLDILLSNDDGVGAPNLLAMAQVLRERGHRVIVSAPCHNYSGAGGMVEFLKPLPPVANDCRGGKVKAGAPPYGPVDARDPSVQYLYGTPVMALSYGLDVLAPAQWGKAPDLVISGPNEGHNTVSIGPNSGTVSVAAQALQRRIPAIALSADATSTRDKPEAARQVAQTLAPLLDKLVGGGELPRSVGLNINIPALHPGAAAPAVAVARTGPGTQYSMRFTVDLSKDPLGSRLVKSSAPGFALVPVPPQSADEEEAVLRSGRISISLMQGDYAAEADTRADILAWRQRLERLR